MSGCTVKHERVTWMRWDDRRMRNVISHPWQYIVTEPDGYERCFDTRREADAWIADNYPEGTPMTSEQLAQLTADLDSDQHAANRAYLAGEMSQADYQQAIALIKSARQKAATLALDALAGTR